MHEFHLPDMTCGHCASKVNVTLKLIDPACEVQVDLPRRLITVKSGEDRDVLVEALADAGYPTL
ncbi:MAG: heavy-metal-associated domain-containing protein [Hydrogenophaga sp.]|uniref:heavy-metal-associated domain-containing protein n=1 Tax=Hydrogenophaga sp. TaxID=1904254 RepID=UPI002735D06F|nr:heavy-metal-associated domain-containing protein [Hydrogenophaga sp.]MDP3349879.1 heavy-metal-associated domain-containing protein [Hydrogenophaga sp.]